MVDTVEGLIQLYDDAIQPESTNMTTTVPSLVNMQLVHFITLNEQSKLVWSTSKKNALTDK